MLELLRRSRLLCSESAVDPRLSANEVLDVLRGAEPDRMEDVRLTSADSLRGGVIPSAMEIRLSATLGGRESTDSRLEPAEHLRTSRLARLSVEMDRSISSAPCMDCRRNVSRWT